MVGIGAGGVLTATAKHDHPSSYDATVTVDASANPTGWIGPNFIGLSFESGTLDTGKFADVGNLPQLLKNLGTSVMRFGGYSVDTSYQGISPSALQGLVRLAGASGWSVLFSEDLGKYNAASVTAESKAVSAALGARLYAMACGNEPDRFPYNGIRYSGYTSADYVSQASACLKAIRAGAPSVPLEGPDFASASSWIAPYVSGEAGTISELGLHYYPLGCAQPGQDPAKLLPAMLSPGLPGKESAQIDSFAAAAKTADAQLILSETNSACNGGIKGLSDSYASALWVIGYILTGADHGVRMMNFHGGLDTYCQGYTPLCEVGANAYRAQPVYYGMLFTHMLGSGYFLPAEVSIHAGAQESRTKTKAKSGNIAAFALRPAHGGGLRLLVENLGNEQANATLRISSNPSTASVLQMTGPAPLATSGVQIQGASVTANGTIQPGQPDTVQCAKEGCAVTVAPYSAALVTFG